MTTARSIRRLAASCLLLAGLSFVWFDIFGGVLRFAAPALRMTPLIYLPSLLGIVALVLYVISCLGNPVSAREGRTVLLILLLLPCSIMISSLLGRPMSAILMALYIWIPAFTFMSLTAMGQQEKFFDAFPAMFICASIGVFLNIFIEMPWSDATYSIGDIEREASRKWSSDGMERLSGFSRNSSVAGMQILFGYCVLESRLRRFRTRALFWIFGLAMIYFTNSKSALMVMAAMPITLLLIGQIRNGAEVRRVWMAAMLTLFWIGVVIFGPIVGIIYGSDYYGIQTGQIAQSSFVDRVINTWPSAISLMDLGSQPVHWITGRGLGGIGAPQTIFEGFGNPADNLSVYLFVSFGLPAVIFGWLIFRGGMNAVFSGGNGRRDFLLISSMLGVASMVNTIEGIFTIMMFALALTRSGQRRTSILQV